LPSPQVLDLILNFEKALFYKFALCSTSLTIENTGKGIKKAPHFCEAFGSPRWSILEPILG